MRLRRTAATISSTLVIAAAQVLPAIANSKRDDGDEPGAPLSTASAIVIFVLIPLAITGLITLFVMAPGWTKKSKELTSYQDVN